MCFPVFRNDEGGTDHEGFELCAADRATRAGPGGAVQRPWNRPHDVQRGHQPPLDGCRRPGADRDGVEPLHRLGKLAEIGAQYLHKGSRVYVAGRLHISRWEDAQTGEQRSSVEILLDDLILLDRPTPEDEQDAEEPQPSAPVPAPYSTT